MLLSVGYRVIGTFKLNDERAVGNARQPKSASFALIDIQAKSVKSLSPPLPFRDTARVNLSVNLLHTNSCLCLLDRGHHFEGVAKRRTSSYIGIESSHRPVKRKTRRLNRNRRVFQTTLRS